MLRTHWCCDSAAAKAYYRLSDYFAEEPRQWFGKGAEMLGLQGEASQRDFELLCDNIRPDTGENLTSVTRDGRRILLDMNFNSTKSVGIVRELWGAGEEARSMVQAAHREAVEYALGYVERDMQTRVRGGGAVADRTTGNIIAMLQTHRETRPDGSDGRSDPSLHDHACIFNATYDAVEDKWKALQVGKVKHDAPYYEAIYHNRLASNLKEMGLGVRRKGRFFEVAGVSDEMIEKFSRRTAYIEAVADKLGITNPETKSKLGATTRLNKVKEREDDWQRYLFSRLTEAEKQQLADLTGQPSYQSSNERAARYAIDHSFERQAVVDERRVYVEAIRHGIGSVTPAGVEEAAKAEGLLVKDGEATTQQVLEQEGRIIAFARGGRGTMRPLGLSASNAIFEKPTESHATGLTSAQGLTANGRSEQTELATLSPEQQAVCRHVWESPDRVIMIEGDAGVGKTHTMKAAVAGIDKPVVVLAPAADASRGVLRRDFPEADTVASFLGSREAQAKARNGVIWIDEAGQLSMNQLDQVFGVAGHVGARVVLQGDRKQHASVERGHIMRVLEEHAGLPVARLTEIRRQTHGDYKQAVASIAKGDILAGYDILDGLGWVRETPAFDHNKPLVDDYLAALGAKKTALVVAPTHAEADEITAEIRARLKEKGALGNDDKTFQVLKPLHLSEAQKADHHNYDGGEVIQFHRNSGAHRAGDRITADHWLHSANAGRPEHFSVYRSESVGLSVGDSIRITGNGWDTVRGRNGEAKRGTHRLNNGAMYTISGFTKEGDIELNNGWVVGKDFGHIAHGYVTTSHASQGKTVDRVLIAMGHESAPAINAEQFYVSVSRGRERATIYSDLAAPVLRDAIQRATKPKTATDLIGQPQKPEPSGWQFVQRVQRAYEQLREKAREFIQEWTQTREPEYVR